MRRLFPMWASLILAGHPAAWSADFPTFSNERLDPSLVKNPRLQTAEAFFNEGNFAGARTALEAYLRAPDDEEDLAHAHYALGLLKARSEDFPGALAQWQAVVRQCPKSVIRPRVLLRIAQMQYGMDRVHEAMQTYQKLVSQYPASPEARTAQMLRVLTHLKQGNLSSAVTEFKLFQSLYPQDEQLQPLAEKLWKASPGQPELFPYLSNQTVVSFLWERGKTAYEQRDYGTAEKYFSRLVLAYPDDPKTPEAAFLRAQLYFESADYVKAAGAYADFLGRVPATDSRVPMALYQEGLSFYRQKAYARASKVLSEFVRRFPDDAPASTAQQMIEQCEVALELGKSAPGMNLDRFGR